MGAGAIGPLTAGRARAWSLDVTALGWRSAWPAGDLEDGVLVTRPERFDVAGKPVTSAGFRPAAFGTVAIEANFWTPAARACITLAGMPVTALEQQLRSAPDGRWELRHVPPAPDLAGLVLGYQGYAEHGGPVLSQREVATTVIPVIVNFGPRFRVSPAHGEERDLQSFVAGLGCGHATVTATGASRCMQIDLTPPGAYRFFARSVREFAGELVALDDLGRDFARLACRLEETDDWSARFRLVDDLVRARLGRTAPPSAEIAWAWRQLRASHGAVRIAELADELGWSRKHLSARFATEIGRPPKAVARLLRFERLQRLLAATTAPDWSALAYHCGYADQAHLVRDFRDFAGTTPTGYLRELRLLRTEDGAGSPASAAGDDR